jgi:hypothetical protein
MGDRRTHPPFSLNGPCADFPTARTRGRTFFPYFCRQKDDERKLIEAIQDEVLAPYFESTSVREGDLAMSGISYKQKLLERRQRSKEDAPAPTSTGVPDPAAPFPGTETMMTEPQKGADAAILRSPPSASAAQPEPSVVPTLSAPATAVAAPIRPPSPAAPTPTAADVPTNPEETRQRIRTLMGLTLKHRGGPGFGKGRLKGPEIDRYENLLREITALLREEAEHSQPTEDPSVRTSVAPTPTAFSTVVQPPPVVASPAVAQTPHTSGGVTPITVGGMDSTIACIEGAITMYKNSPPQLQQSVLVTLRAALVAAVDSCNVVLAAQPPPPAVHGSPDGRIDGMIACIEGAVTMYRNSPPQLRESVLVTLRIALMSAVETCNAVVPGGAPPQQQHVVPVEAVHDGPVVAVTPPPVPRSPVAPAAPPLMGTDPNSRALEEIYGSVKAAHGGGSLGLRSDLTPGEASQLADDLVDMRRMLMEELESGIPDPSPVGGSTGSSDESSASRYHAMLAKARAEKASAP